MKPPRFRTHHVIIAAVLGSVVTLFASCLALWLVLGPNVLSILEGWSIARTGFVGDYDPAQVADGALAGMVAGLGDRWSYYLTAEDYAALKQRRSNTYVGIGVTVSYEDPRGLLLRSVTAGGPADRAGLREGELITAVDGTDVTGDARYNGSDLIAGEADTAVKLTVLSAGGGERTVEVTRGEVETQAVKYELMEDDVGYVRLENFYANSAERLNAAVDDLVSQGAGALVFDLRDNGGGYVGELTDMLDHLLPEGPIFREWSKSGKENVIDSDENYVNLPMAVLVNKNTYSSAEFFAAQLRESAGAVIVGEKTFGKGYAQQAFPLPNGGAVNISTAKYATGAGVSLVGTGVTLDAELSLSEEAAAALRAGVLDHADDAQLQKALELLRE